MISLDHIPTMFDKPLIGIVYSIVNKTTGRSYIGSTIINRNRLKQHFNSLRKGKHWISKLQTDYNQYGEDDFKVDVLEKAEQNFIALAPIEQGLIKILSPYYNLRKY